MAVVPDAPCDAHEWVSFEDPAEDRSWLVDVTFLSSCWQCIYGADARESHRANARTDGRLLFVTEAHFTTRRMPSAVAAAAETLSREQWQFRSKGRRNAGVLKARLERGHDHPPRRRSLHLLEPPGSPGGAGCALHRAAIDRGVLPLQLKPDVCWQLPLRREDTVAANGHVTSSLGEWGGGDTGAKVERGVQLVVHGRHPSAFSGARPRCTSRIRDEIVRHGRTGRLRPCSPRISGPGKVEECRCSRMPPPFASTPPTRAPGNRPTKPDGGRMRRRHPVVGSVALALYLRGLKVRARTEPAGSSGSSSSSDS